MINRNQTERIDRYLSGAMSSDEQARFHADLVADPKLRTMLDAEELIRGTIRRDVNALPLDHPATRAHVMGTLAALSTAARSGAIPDMKGGGGSVPGGGAFWSSGAGKIVLGVMVGAGLTAGGFAIVFHPASVTSVRNSSPGIDRQAHAPVVPLPQVPTDTQSSASQPAAPPAAGSSPIRHPAEISSREGSGDIRHSHPSQEKPTQRTSMAMPEVDEAHAHAAESPPPASSSQPKVHNRKSVDLKMQVDTPKEVKPK